MIRNSSLRWHISREFFHYSWVWLVKNLTEYFISVSDSTDEVYNLWQYVEKTNRFSIKNCSNLVDVKSEDPMHPHLSYVDLTYEGVMDLCYGAHFGTF